MHGFYIPNIDLWVEPSEAGMDWFGNTIPEEKALVDDYIMNSKWFRQTYDFGDDWRHKIVYEKTDPTYQERYAQILKWKGDHFREDIGGVTGAFLHDTEETVDGAAMETRIVFDLDQINKELEKQSFPERRRRKTKSSDRLKKTMKDLAVLFKGLQKAAGADTKTQKKQ